MGLWLIDLSGLSGLKFIQMQKQLQCTYLLITNIQITKADICVSVCVLAFLSCEITSKTKMIE